MRARYYNVDIKRFINQDILVGTIANSQSLNRYAYVEGNPVSYLDPFGLEKTIYDQLHEGVHKLIDIANTGFAVMGVISLLLSIVCPAIAPIYLVLYVATFTLLYLFDIGVYCNQFVDALINDDLDTALECCNGIFYDLLGFFLAVVLDMLMDVAFDYMINTVGQKIKSLFANMEDSLKSFWNDNGGYVNLDAFGDGSGEFRNADYGWEKISQDLVDNSTDVSSWNKGSFDSIQDSLASHFYKHGAEVGATSVEQYIRKAEGFMQNLRGSKKYPVDGAVEGVIRYVKNGKYIDLAPDGTIISFGKR